MLREPNGSSANVEKYAGGMGRLRRGAVSPRERAHWDAHGYAPIRTISPDLIADRRTRHSGARGKRSARRLDLLRRMMMAILRPACSARNDSVWVLRCYVGAL